MYAMHNDRPLPKILKWCNNQLEAEHVRTRWITSLLDTSDCGKMLWERKIYILSPSIHSNLNCCVQADESTWRPGPLIEVVGVETRVEW